jgi:hypothetical protein
MASHYVLRVNPTHGRHRTRRRRNPTKPRAAAAKGISPAILIGAGVAGVALILWARSSGAQTAQIPSPGSSTGGGGGPSASGLDARLQSSEQAREVWIFQAELYMYSVTTALPDGIIGPVTQNLITTVNSATGYGSSNEWTQEMVQRARQYIFQLDQQETGGSETFQAGSSVFPPATAALPVGSIPSASTLALLQQTAQSVDPGTPLNWA